MKSIGKSLFPVNQKIIAGYFQTDAETADIDWGQVLNYQFCLLLPTRTFKEEIIRAITFKCS
jgi:hypothetical protein